jgi:hypothetical protein
MASKTPPADVANLIAQLVGIVEHRHSTTKIRADAITHAYELGVIEGRLQGAMEFKEQLDKAASKRAAETSS